MKVAEYVADFLANLSNQPDRTRVYGICGAGAMHLNDAICHHAGIDMVPMQHEQAATFAAEAEARVTGNIGVVSVTAGPGGSNTLTGVACAYVDSIPLLVIAGQVTTHTIGNRLVRQGGMNELPMVELMRPITKHAVTVMRPDCVRLELEKALFLATTGRKGPVYVEFPLDVQAAEVDPDQLEAFQPWEPSSADIYPVVEKIYGYLEAAKRPVVIIGNGVRLAGACAELRIMVNRLQAPVISSWSAADIISTDHPCYIGRCGIFGDRASNWVVQNADLILAIGTRLSPAQTGHHAHLFAPKALKIVVDVDIAEAKKKSIGAWIGLTCGAKRFLEAFKPGTHKGTWLEECRSRMVPEERALSPAQLTSYGFIEALNPLLEDDAVVITDVGFCFIPTMQTLRLKDTQRLIHSCGVSPMGWALPAAIGAALSTDRQVVCLTGDGGLMLNIQELYTVASENLPIAIFVYCNNGYATMRIAQNNHFKRESISGPNSGLPISADMLLRVARGFGIRTVDIQSGAGLTAAVQAALKSRGPVFVVLRLPEDELITPRVQAAMEDGGKFKPVELIDQWPRLANPKPEPALLLPEPSL